VVGMGMNDSALILWWGGKRMIIFTEDVRSMG